MNYEFKTTFWSDFSIADRFGAEAVVDTCKRAFKEWKNNVEYVTELVMVLNWKCFTHYDKGNETLSELYSKLFYDVRDWCFDNLKGEELQYFIRTID